MLPSTIAGERVKAISANASKLRKAEHSVKHRQATHRTLLDIRGQHAALFTIPDELRFGIRKTSDHDCNASKTSKRQKTSSVGPLACQNRKPLTLVPLIALAAADGLECLTP